MFIFRREPASTLNVQQVFVTLLVGVIVFGIIMYYLVPMLVGFEPVHKILTWGIPLLAIVLLIDLFL